MAKAGNSRPIAVSMGDPAGVGPEVILKAVAGCRRNGESAPLLVLGDLGAMRAAAKRLHSVPNPVAWLPGERTAAGDTLSVMEISALTPSALRPGHPTVAGADGAYRYVVAGARMALRGEASALVTAPINKEWMHRAGHRYPGHSELLASIARVRAWRMMFAGEQLKVALVTVHMALSEVPRALSRERVYRTITLLADHLRSRLAMARPRIAVLGLNPHAGEGTLFGDEERRVILPAIKRAGAAGIDAYGPVAPDTAFARPRGSFEFDAAVAMYHDQGLIALKTLEFDRAVNITLGLPFVRTSPDHGTAFDIAGRGEASDGSMRAAVEYAVRSVSPAAHRAARAA